MKTNNRQRLSDLFADLLLAFVVAVAITAVALVVWYSRNLAYAYTHPARPERYVTGAFLTANGVAYQDVELVAEDGVYLSAWYVPPKNGCVILTAHGYGEQRPQTPLLVLTGRGYGVLSWDFRAHGRSGGDFTSLGYYEVRDVKVALDYALAQPGVRRVGAWGASMGAVTLIRAAATFQQIEALISDSAFSSLEDELNRQAPYPAIVPFIRYFAEQEMSASFDAVRAVDDIGRISPRPVLIIQSSNDQVVPLDSALRLYENAGAPRELWIEGRAPHGGMYAYYPEEYTERIFAFFDRYLLGR